ncbi:MAG TPA: hypothetical protein VHQ65_13210 [Thermoanaerobaculia bacterium]|nr:hypothetical protein [Thermoanaerobaculia bacterium]
MSSPHHRRIEGPAVASCAAAAVLIPYLTLGLPFRTALVVQAALILAAVLALGAVTWSRGRRGPRLAAFVPVPLRTGLLLWAAAAALGAAVGFARGNEPRLVAGQLLAMGLLPLAAAAALPVPAPALRRPLLLGVAGATAAAAVLHLAHWAVALGQGRLVARLYFANDVAVVGSALLALLACGAVLLTARRGARWAAAAAVPLLLAYVVGSGVRSLWLVTPFAAGLFLAAAVPLRRWRPGRAWLLPVAVLALLALGILATHRWWLAPRPDVLPAGAFPYQQRPARPDLEIVAAGLAPGSTLPALRWSVGPWRSLILAEAPVRPQAFYRGRAELRGEGTGYCLLVIDWLRENGELLGRGQGRPIFPRGRFRTAEVAAVAPSRTASARLRLTCEEGTRGRWDVRWLELHALAPAGGALAASHLEYLLARARSLRGLDPALPRVADVSLSLRYAESRVLVRRLRDARPGELLWGQGLGATFRPEPPEAGPGAGTAAEPVNYIHNFYLFLPFKLGAAGGLAVLTALALFAGVPLIRLRRAAPDERVFLAVAFTAWTAYAVWAVACPLIIDFRMAPLWGLLVAACRSTPPGAAGRDTSAPGPDD